MLRYIKREPFFELFFVAGIATILTVRLFLMLAGYPQLGGGVGLHIAHVLWGGLLMMAAVVTALNFVANPFVLRLIALLGGAGFGLFIDEVGKFVTQDVDYFYKPTFSIIYVIFIIIYLANYAIAHRSYTRNEYLINSVELMKEAVLKKINSDERQAALGYLARCGESTAVAPLLGTFYEGLEGVEAPTKNSVQRGVERIAAWHASLADKGWFSTVIILLFALDALFLLVVVGFVSVYSTMETVDITDWIVVVAAAAEALLIVYGLFRLRSARIRTYTAFRYGLLVSILIARVFSFYDDPIDALCWLAVDLLLLWSLDRMVEQERRQSVQFQG